MKCIFVGYSATQKGYVCWSPVEKMHFRELEPYYTQKVAKKDPKWKAAMHEELGALEKNRTWELVKLPEGKRAVGLSVVSRYMHDPRNGHMDVVYQILRYLKSAPGKGLIFRKNGHVSIEGYCDSDWASCADDRRSTSGYCIFVGGNLVSWKSKKQSVVARSTAEAEYRAMALGVTELLWLKMATLSSL
ncbi:uncharacterized protein LOC109823557 [Asparagus officinalis]|uniref:uncharacterized protein LOC109823557 n=1 Tax=Asparagus officinalis TaxID=4686 RepID=UPI00098E637D|nr:uncharacterized protein LOC109823557 [Asparagus officinalis]